MFGGTIASQGAGKENKAVGMLRYLLFGVISLAIASLIVLAAMSSTRVWHGQTKLIPSDGGRDGRFGSAMALNEETLVVGATNAGRDSNSRGGAAYVFERSTTAPSWIEQIKLIPADLQAGDGFGAKVAVSGDSIAIAAPNARRSESDRDIYRGVVYVFARDGSTWSEQTRLVSPSSIVEQYGVSIALEGDTLVVGEQGAVQVFGRDPQTNRWSQHTTLTASNPQWAFGPAVSLSGDTIAVGGNGLVFVFGRDQVTGVWQEQAQVEELEAAGFGHALALQGDRLVVGAYEEPQLLYVKTGAVYVFERDSARGIWRQQAKLRPQGAQVGRWLTHFLNLYAFGINVILDRDAIVVSACAPAGTFFFSEERASYLFRQNQRTGRWLQQAKLMPPAPSQQKGFCTTALSGDTLLAGAPAEASEDGKRAMGAVYLFDLRDGTP